MADWGTQAFEGVSWVGSGIDSLQAWLNQDGVEGDEHGLTSDPLHLIGSGSKSARGMVDIARVADVWGGGYTDAVGLYGGPSVFTGVTSAAVHDISPNSSAVRAIWKMRFAGHKSFGGLNPNYEDPTDSGTVGSFRGSAPPDPDDGSDSVALLLDVTQDYLALSTGTPVGSSSVNQDAEPLISQFHRNHSIVWPFRVRMNRSVAPGGRVTGWNQPAQLAQNWPTLCEARLFQVTDTSGLVQFIIKLVWYAEIQPGDYDPEDLTNSTVQSEDYILLAAYAGDATPTNLESPFFHFDAASAQPIWDEVECEMTATVAGSVSLRITSLDTGLSQAIAIGGQDPIVSGGLNGVIPVLALGSGQAHVDIGCSYLSATKYDDLGLGIYPAEAASFEHYLTWSMDEVRGEDFEVGQASGGTFFSTTFDEFMQAADQAQPQTIGIAGWPKQQSEMLTLIHEGLAAGKHWSIWPGADLKNFWSEDAAQLITGATAISSDTGVDLDGSIGSSPWEFALNNNVRVGATASNANVRPVLSRQGNGTASIFYPVSGQVGELGKLGFGIFKNTGTDEEGAIKFRFRNTAAGSTFSTPFGLGVYSYWFKFPHIQLVPTTGAGRANQTEVCLFTDSATQTAAGAGGTGTPPNGVGLRFRAGTTQYRIEFFVQGTSASDTLHEVADNVNANANEYLFQSVDLGANIEFRLWINGVKYFTNAAGTADFQLAKSVIDADLEHGIGLHGAGQVTQVPNLARAFMFMVYGAEPFGIGVGQYQGVFQRRNDGALQSTPILNAFHDGDVVCGPNPNDPEGPAYFRGGRVRHSAGTTPPGEVGLTRYYSLIDPIGGTVGQPFAEMDTNEPMLVSAVFPTRLDGEILGAEETGVGGLNKHVWYRGLYIRGKPNEWIHLDGLTGTIGQPFGAGPDMFIAKGVNLILWGNKSDVSGDTFVSNINLQIVYVRDDETESHSVPSAPSDLDPNSFPAESFLFRTVLEEQIDQQSGDRTFIASIFRGLPGGGFDGVAAASTQLTVTGADWAAASMGEEWGPFYCLKETTGVGGNFGISTVWMTQISGGVQAGVVSPDSTFNTLVGTALGTQSNKVIDVRGVVTKQLTHRRITDVRGRVEGDISQRLDLPLERRLLVFERDENGRVPGSFLSAAPGDWYRFGISDGNEIDWGSPIQNYDSSRLRAHRLVPSRISYAPSGEATMSIVQETIQYTGGHLRPGQLVVYVEEVRGREWQQDPATQAIYGGNGIRILFRGEITAATRNRQESTIVYEASGPEFMAARIDLLELSACSVGKIAYNVEPGSIQTPFAVSKNLTFTNEFTPQFSPDNKGSMLGYGTPDLVGMQLCDVIEHFLNKYAQQLESLGIMRLNSAGVFTVANGDGTVTTFGPKSTLTAANKAPNINQYGYDATSSIVWRPNREAFSLIPTETLIQGRVIDIIRGLLANLPDIRMRIEPNTLRWSFETLDSLRSVTVNSSRPGSIIELQDDSTEVFTAAVFSSPWRREESFDASLKSGTIQPAWLDGFDLEGTWSGPFAQIGKFQGEVTEANNFPYNPVGVDPEPGPQSTIMIVRVNIGSPENKLAVGTFNGVTVKFLNGEGKGHRGTVTNSGQHGGVSGEFQYFYIVFEPALPGGYGSAVIDVVGDLVEVNDDPKEPTTNSANAYSRTWADYVLLEPDSGRIINNLAPGGSWRLDEVLPNGCPNPNGVSQDVLKTLPANSVVVNGQLVTSPFPLASAGSACQAGNSVAATACGGDIIYRAVRIQEGTWCARSPEVGFAGTAYRDIVEYEGVIHSVHSDSKGFVDGNAHWLKHQWEPQGGSFAKILLVGGFRLMFSVSPPVSDTDDVNGPIGFSFIGGWDVTPLDADQSGDYFEERSLDADQNVADWNDGAGDAWDTTMGLRFKSVGGNYGPRRGCIISRHIPSVLPATTGTFEPLGLAGSTNDTALNNNTQLVATLQLDPNDPVTSLCSIAFILRGENGFLEQLRVPPNDGEESPGDSYFDEKLFKIDALNGRIGGATGVEWQRGMCAYARNYDGDWINDPTFEAVVDYIPDWISNTGSRKSFREASTPTTSGLYNGLNVLGSDGDVVDARFPFSDAGPVSLTLGDSNDRYTSASGAFSVAQKADKRGLELGTTGYVFRYVRADEPDSLYDKSETDSTRAYPTLFWYHTRVAVDGNGQPVKTTTGEPVYEGVKEIIWQGNLSTFVDAARLQNGSVPITVKFSVETPVPNGFSNKLTVSISPNIFSTFYNHTNPGRFVMNQQHFPGGVFSFGINVIDGCYSDEGRGFSMAMGAGGFGLGVGKVRMTNGSQGDNSAKPAKVTLLQIRKINRPPFNFGAGVTPQQAMDAVQGEYDSNGAKVAYVTENGVNSLRFDHDSAHPDGTAGAYIPAAGDHYRIFMDRGWGIARMATFNASGLDDPTKVWIFRHMADSALKSAQNKNYVGAITIEGVAHELVDGALKVNVSAEDGFTGLESAEQVVGAVQYDLVARTTTLQVNRDGRGVFSRIDEILEKEAQKEAVKQVPSFLSEDSQFNQGRVSSLAPAGIDSTSASGFGGSAPALCSDNVVVSDPITGTQKSLTNQFLALREEFWRLWILVGANKDDGGGGGDPPIEQTGRGGTGVSLKDVLRAPSVASSILSMMEKQGRSIGDLVFTDYAFADADGQLYSVRAEKRTSYGEILFSWVPVKSDSEKSGYYEIDTAVATRPREAGKARYSLGTGSPLEASYVINADFKTPIVTVYAATGFSAGTGSTAVAGDLLTDGNVPGFNIQVSDADEVTVTISADAEFGPVTVILSS